VGRNGAGFLGLVILTALIGAGCTSGGSDAARSAPGSKDLNSPPFALGVNTRLWGVGPDNLFVLDGRRVATYDFAASEWRRLPDAPELASVQVTNVDETVLVLGTECDGSCSEDEPAPVGVVALDLKRDDGWKHTDAGLRSDHGFGFRDFGQAGDERILGYGTGLLALRANAALRKVSSPDVRRFATCRTANGMQSLVPDVPPPLPGDPMLPPICGGRGVLVMTLTRTMEWDGRTWSVHASAPDGAVVNGSTVVTRSGTVVAPIGGGNLAAYANGSWKTITVAEGSLLQPPILSVAAVGGRVVVFDAPRSESATGTLETLAL
jgi:hypothetical protein